MSGDMLRIRGSTLVTVGLLFVVLVGVVGAAIIVLESGDSPSDEEPNTMEPDATNEQAGSSHAGGVDTQNEQMAVSLTIEPAAVEPGEALNLTGILTNPGERESTEEIEFRFDGSTIHTEEITLSGGETTEITVTHSIGSKTAGQYPVTIKSAADESESTVSVTPPTERAGYFTIDIDEMKSPIAAGDTLEVHATITNYGESADYQQILLKASNDTIVDKIAAPPLTLLEDESKHVTLSWETNASHVGTANISVQTSDEYPWYTVEIKEPRATASFEVTIEETNSPVSAGENLSVTATVENTGAVVGSQPIQLLTGNETADSTEYGPVSLEPDESQTIEFELETTEDDVGTQELTVLSEDTESTVTVEIHSETDSEN